MASVICTFQASIYEELRSRDLERLDLQNQINDLKVIQISLHNDVKTKHNTVLNLQEHLS